VPAATKLRHLRRRETGAGEQDERIKRRETERTGRDGTGLDWTRVILFLCDRNRDFYRGYSKNHRGTSVRSDLKR
jgi:hypothetical protein